MISENSQIDFLPYQIHTKWRKTGLTVKRHTESQSTSISHGVSAPLHPQPAFNFLVSVRLTYSDFWIPFSYRDELRLGHPWVIPYVVLCGMKSLPQISTSTMDKLNGLWSYGGIIASNSLYVCKSLAFKQQQLYIFQLWLQHFIVDE